MQAVVFLKGLQAQFAPTDQLIKVARWTSSYIWPADVLVLIGHEHSTRATDGKH